MSREILFKAKQLNGKWIEGDLYHGRNYCAIHNNRTKGSDGTPILLTPVDPSTVSQYTGMKDKNGNRIFEGDILEARLDDDYPENITRVAVGWEFNGWVFIQHEYGQILTDRADDSGDSPFRFVLSKCSECGELYEYGDQDDWHDRFFNFCPNCGAKMDGGAGDG